MGWWRKPNLDKFFELLAYEWRWDEKSHVWPDRKPLEGISGRVENDQFIFMGQRSLRSEKVKDINIIYLNFEEPNGIQPREGAWADKYRAMVLEALQGENHWYIGFHGNFRWD